MSSIGKLRNYLSVLVTTSGLFFLGVTEAAVAQKNILVVHSYHSNYAWTASARDGIDEGFNDYKEDIQIFHEFLDAKRHPELQFQKNYLNYLQEKYQDTPIDLAMVSDDPALSLLMTKQPNFLENIPVIFLGINQVRPDILNRSGMTGIFEYHSLEASLIEAARQSQVDSVVVLNDSSETGLANLQRLLEIKKNIPNAPDIQVISDVVFDPANPSTITQKFAKISPEVPIFIAGQIRQKSLDGALIPFEEGTAALRQHLPNPLYGSTAMSMGHGIVGGKILNGKFHALQAIKLAKQVLDGIPIRNISPILRSENQWIFDTRELNRFNINSDSLPGNSKLLFAEPSFYKKYRVLVWGTMTVFVIALIIIGLLIEIIRRRDVASCILQENKQRYKDLAEAGADVFWEIDQDLNLSHLSGNLPSPQNQSPQLLLGKPYLEMFLSLPNLDFEKKYLESLISSHQPIHDFQFRISENNHMVRIFKLNGRPIFDQHQTFLGYRGVQREVTEEYNLAQTLAYNATYDSLTGLINRHEFDIRLRGAVLRAHQMGFESVLCYLDLDQFKLVNDTAGHLVGDQLLSELTQVLKNALSPEDHLGRLGGDEFGLIIENCSLERGQRICQGLIDAVMNFRFRWKSRKFNVGVSIGLIPISAGETTATELLSRADLACYKAKDLGRGRIYVTTSDDLELELRQTEMSRVGNISQAIEEDRFFLVYQPIMSLNSPDELLHHEILLRLKDEAGNIISPAQFIPVAERFGMVSLIDRWVIETVIEQYDHVFPHAKPLISINLSGASLSDDRFIEYVTELIHQSPLDPHKLCFEITETAAISHLDVVTDFIHQLKKIGVKFALDDFGSGLSSFGYLRRLPVDYLKIDGSLIRCILEEESDYAIVDSINRIAHMMGMATIAEFVENAEILEVMKMIGIDFAQGYGVSQPIALNKDILLPHSLAASKD